MFLVVHLYAANHDSNPNCSCCSRNTLLYINIHVFTHVTIIFTGTQITAQGEAAVIAALANNVIVEVDGLSGMVLGMHTPNVQHVNDLNKDA